jgi:hypothetical protein
MRKAAPASPKKADVLKQIEDSALEVLPEVFETLMEVARGTRFGVAIEGTGGRPRKGTATNTGIRGKALEKFCPHCRNMFPVHPPEIVEVWQTLPDTVLLRYIHEYLAGKAKVREEERPDTIINVYFGEIDTVYTPETPALEGLEELLTR